MGVYEAADAIHGVPAGGEVLTDPKVPEYTSHAFIALEGERIWIRRVLCGGCRRVMGWGFIGELPALSEPQLRELQKALGFSDAVPALREAAAWRKQAIPSITPSR